METVKLEKHLLDIKIAQAETLGEIKNLAEKVSHHDETLYGNGKEGLKIRVDRIEQQDRLRGCHFKFAWICITAIASGLVWISSSLITGCGSDTPETPEAPPQPPAAVASAYLGGDFLAAMSPRFPCAQALEVFEGIERPALGVLWSTFGTNTDCLRDFLYQSKDRPHLLRVHLTNEVCRRHGNCAEGELFGWQDPQDYNYHLESKNPEIFGALEARLNEILNFFEGAKNENSKLYISYGLEDNYNHQAAQALADRFGNIEGFTPVRNPVNYSPVFGPGFLELHGTEINAPERGCITSLDGNDIEFPHRATAHHDTRTLSQVVQYLHLYRNRCEAIFLWSARWQGIDSSRGFIDPLDRYFYVDGEDILLINEMLRTAQKLE